MIAKIDPAETWLQPAQKRLAMLAAEMRGWSFDATDHEFYDAILAAENAGWTWGRIVREAFRLLLTENAGPSDLRIAARRPGETAERAPTYGDARNRAVVSTLQRARERADEAAARIQAQGRGATRPASSTGDDAA